MAAASEEALYATTHTARAILLQAGVFPLSRPEIVEQLAGGGHRPLVELLRPLLTHDQDARFLHRALRYLKRLLVSLDKDAYGQFATQYAQSAARRVAHRANARMQTNR